MSTKIKSQQTLHLDRANSTWSICYLMMPHLVKAVSITWWIQEKDNLVQEDRLQTAAVFWLRLEPDTEYNSGILRERHVWMSMIWKPNQRCNSVQWKQNEPCHTPTEDEDFVWASICYSYTYTLLIINIYLHSPITPYCRLRTSLHAGWWFSSTDS
jgi:hypothetical protein